MPALAPTLAAPRIPHPGLAERLLGSARQALDGARPREALPLLDRLDRLPGQEATAAGLRAEALLELGRLPEAEAAADRAVAADETAGAARTLRARVRLARGHVPGAIEDAAAAVMADPADPGAKVLLGAALLEDRRFDEAIYFLGNALEAEPGNPGTALRLAQAFMLAGRHDAAAELIGHAEAQGAVTAPLLALRAQNRLLAGDAADAERIAAAGLGATGPHGALLSLLAHAMIAQGRMQDAAPHLAAAARLAPGDTYLAHLAATAAGVTSARATDGYVSLLFDGYAPRFEESLLGLGYRVPGLMRRAVERLPAMVAGGRLGPVLDLGCGTGLVGAVLADLRGPVLVGVDLSAAMLREAAAKQVYSALRQAEIGAALADDPAAYALITAADVFCYFGDLGEVLPLCRARLAPEGVFLFSVERLPDGEGCRLGPSGRYAHASDAISAALAAAGLEGTLAPEDLRLDAGGPVPGLFVTARVRRH